MAIYRAPHLSDRRPYLGLRRAICWWFECEPDWDRFSQNGVIPCSRCGAHDTTYEARVGVSRHTQAMEALTYWTFRRWFPAKCTCGRRGNHEETGDCIPF